MVAVHPIKAMASLTDKADQADRADMLSQTEKVPGIIKIESKTSTSDNI